jgi:hypothetical protein
MREFIAALVLSWFVADTTMLLFPLPRAQTDELVKLASVCVPPKDQARHTSGTSALLSVHAVPTERIVASGMAPARQAADTRKKSRKKGERSPRGG